MKRICYSALFLLSACSTTPDASKEQQAISDYIKANANDPTSYEAVRWGKSEGFSRKDSLKAIVQPLLDDMRAYNMQRGFIDKAMASAAFTDTTRVGTQLYHAYRVKNKLGAIVLDSAQFVVYKSGKISQL